MVVGANALNTEKEYGITIIVKDSMGNTSSSTTVSTLYYIMDVRYTGKGVSIGKLSEKDEFEVGMPADFKNDLKINGRNILYLIRDMLYPVGTIYMSISSTNPGTLFGGTWIAWGTGRVPVGINTADGNFNTVEKTGGVAANNFDHAHITQSVGLTVGQLPPHSHSLYNKVKHILYDTGINDTSFGWHAGTSTGYRASPNSAPYLIGVNNTGSGQAHNHGNTGNALSWVSNLQPYITCYMWKRTA